MVEAIRNLWPPAKTDVLSPTAILKRQASYLRADTQGILEAEVKVDNSSERWMRATFRIIAPALDRYECELFMIVHRHQKPYPVAVYCEGLMSEIHKAGLSRLLTEDKDSSDEPSLEVSASTAEDFTIVLEMILKSARTAELLNSLFARTNDLSE